MNKNNNNKYISLWILKTNKESMDEGNIKSLIFAPYNSYIESNIEEEEKDWKNKKRKQI